jgi:hypothetical protein
MCRIDNMGSMTTKKPMVFQRSFELADFEVKTRLARQNLTHSPSDKKKHFMQQKGARITLPSWKKKNRTHCNPNSVNENDKLTCRSLIFFGYLKKPADSLNQNES